MVKIMASLFGSFNKKRLFDVDTTGFEYCSLQELLDRYGEDHTYMVQGLYINTKGLYEPAPVAALEDCYVNLPSHLTTTVNDIINDPRCVAAINSGHCGFMIRTYHQEKYNRDCLTIEWCDI